MQYRKSVEQINALEPAIAKLSDEQLAARDPGASQEACRRRQARFAPSRGVRGRARSVEARAGHAPLRHAEWWAASRCTRARSRRCVRAKARRSWPRCRHTSCARSKGVHIVTVNDYLARRDSGVDGTHPSLPRLTVGVVVPQMDPAEKQRSYQADITYGTNNEFRLRLSSRQHGDDGRRALPAGPELRDRRRGGLDPQPRRAPRSSSRASRGFDGALRAHQCPHPAARAAEEEDGEGDYWVDLRQHTVMLSEKGHEHAEDI